MTPSCAISYGPCTVHTGPSKHLHLRTGGVRPWPLVLTVLPSVSGLFPVAYRSAVPSRCLQVAGFPPLLWQSNSPAVNVSCVVLIHAPTDGRGGCRHTAAAVNRAPDNKGERGSPLDAGSVSFEHSPGSGVAGAQAPASTFEGPPEFPWWLHRFVFLCTVHEGPPFFTPIPSLWPFV